MASAANSVQEVDEALVYVELSGIIEEDWREKLLQGNLCKIIGLETDTPILQFDRYVFIGEYKDTAGSDVFFEISKSNNLKLSEIANKRLCMERAFLNERNAEGIDTLEQADITAGEFEEKDQLLGDGTERACLTNEITSKNDIEQGRNDDTPNDRERTKDTDVT